ncbi:LPXTG cell wall anchor domain-containing protein [Bacillus sp. CHD6a]|uniref:LPXTG cell wall anchor domain-containing protein n=1 Tax=Bacillus sp. CHD6a TaxID=1643452 RepID=UPI0006CDF088|nr:LPXTG cell wall anchor domain-containing protein [Bacillus sp. CHD6a]KPB04645.1 hypothetical protein AAV98_09980 [Bacillus sp. CHD6a]
MLVSALVFILVTTPFSTKAANLENLYIEQGEQVTLFHPVKLAPSRVMEEKVITITNKNEEAVEFAASFHFYLEKNGLESQKLQQMLEFYELSAKIHLPGKVHHINWTSLTEVNEKLQELELNQIPSKGSLEIMYSIRLLETAHNDFQAVTLHGELFIDSLTEKSQVGTIVKNKEETKGNSLPKTATDTWTFMYIGILLSIGGSALLIYYSIRMIQRKRGNLYGG